MPSSFSGNFATGNACPAELFTDLLFQQFLLPFGIRGVLQADVLEATAPCFLELHVLPGRHPLLRHDCPEHGTHCPVCGRTNYRVAVHAAGNDPRREYGHQVLRADVQEQRLQHAARLANGQRVGGMRLHRRRNL